MHTSYLQRGVTAVEVVIGVSIAGLAITYSIFAINSFINGARDVADKTEALFLAEEGVEMVRYIKDNNWNTIQNLTANTAYYIAASSTTVTVTTTPQVIGKYTRSFTVRGVSRHASTDDIVPDGTSGAVVDTASRYVVSSVSWGSPTKTVSLESIVANLEP